MVHDNNGHNENAPGQNKTYTIVVNGVQKTTDKHKVSYEDILTLQGLVADTANPYLVTYERGPEGHASGILETERTVTIKDGMVFSVTPTGQS